MSDDIYQRVVKIIGPFARNKEALNNITPETKILTELNVNSSKLVDVILAFEDEFDIEIGDDEVKQVTSIKVAVDMISGKVN